MQWIFTEENLRVEFSHDDVRSRGDPGNAILDPKVVIFIRVWAVTLRLNIWSSLGRDTCYSVAGVMCFVSALFATC